MVALIEETGNRYGNLVVLGRATENEHGAHWVCECDCGSFVIALGSTLRAEHRKTCGCGRGGKLTEGKAALNNLIWTYKRNAKRRGYNFELNSDEFGELTKQNCHYCGVEPSQTRTGKTYNGAYKYNGVDRIDNKKGYTVDNVVTCCKWCNQAKQQLSSEEFVNRCRAVAEHE